MIEKVNPKHPDKVADRIAGAIVDIAYQQDESVKIAVEVLIGHGVCHAIIETDIVIDQDEVRRAIERIGGTVEIDLVVVEQDAHLHRNQDGGVRCGDNGIFKGVPLTEEEKRLSEIARDIYERYSHDGKYILDGDKLTICQSNARAEDLERLYPGATINPLGYWTGGTSVDTGATNRKLGSDMAQSVTGGGLHGKDLSKADVSVNIYAFLKAQETGETVELCCAIGDEEVGGISYEEMVEVARDYIAQVRGFEKFAEWGAVLAARIDLNKQAQEILAAAQRSGVEQNFLFVTTFKRYQVQLKILNDLEREISDSGALVTKEYVKGRENVYSHPAINSYNRTADSANRTASTLMKVITSLKDVSLDVEYDDDDL